MNSLKKKTISGVAWTFGQQVGVQGINFIVQILLARILLPSDFGLIAMIQIFLSIGIALMDSGMTSSLIRTEEPDERDYSTVFFINLIVSIIIYLVLFFTAPFIADFFDQDVLKSIIRIYTLTFIIQALVGVQSAKLTKEMNFRLQMFMQLPSSLIGGVFGVILAYNGYGVWSLVWMQILTSFLFMIQHWFRTDWRPSLIFDKTKIKYHFNFGYKVTISSVLTAFYHDLNKIIVGKFFSATQLGFYNQADTFRRIPVRHLTAALQKVTYPVFASIQNDNQRMKKGLKEITLLVFFVICPIMFSLSLVAEPLFRVVLTSKWLPSVPYFQILVISSIFYPVSLYNLNIILAKGRSDLHVKAEFIKKTLSLFSLLLIIPYGLMGAAYSGALSMIIHAVVNFIFCGRLINYPLIQQVKHIVPIFFISILSFLITLYLKDIFYSAKVVNDFKIILIVLVTYNVIYVLLSFVMKISAIQSIKSLIKNVLEVVKK